MTTEKEKLPYFEMSSFFSLEMSFGLGNKIRHYFWRQEQIHQVHPKTWFSGPYFSAN